MPRRKQTPEQTGTPDQRAHEMAQVLIALEVAICILTVIGLAKKPQRLALVVGHLRALATQAVYQVDGPDPSTLDRLADQIEIGHEATS